MSNTPICNGSGVIIAKHGNTYKVLTAEHVVRNDASCDRRVLDVVTYDGKPHQVKTENNGTVQTLEGVDLAVLQFTSNENYRVATLARRDLEQKGGLVFVSGWPSSKRTGKETSRLFTVGTLFNQELGVLRAESSVSLNLGYGLVYTNIATAGVSGGPVLDVRGHVIGIHGRVDADTPVEEAGPGHTIQLGYSLGIPISTFLSLVNKVGIQPEQLQIYPLKPPLLTNQEEIAIVKALLKVEKPSDNSDVIAWLNYGNQLWRQFKYKEALGAFDHAIQLKPHFYQAWYSRGQTLLGLERYSEALEAFNKTIQESKIALSKEQGEFIPAWRGQGEALINLHRYKEALASFEQAIALDDKDFIVRMWQGVVLQNLERYEDALAAYNKAIAINSHPWAYNNRGFVRYKLGDKQGAITDFNKAIEIAPNYAEAYLSRGQIKYEWGDREGALADDNKAIEVNPYYANSYFSRGLLRYYHENRQGGIADLGKAIQLNPKNAFFYYKWAGINYNEGDNKEAIAYYNKAIENDANFAAAYYDRGLALRKIGNNQAAIADFHKAADLYQQQGTPPAFSQQALERITELQRTASVPQISKVAFYEGPALNTTYQSRGKLSFKINEIDSSSRRVKVWIASSQGLYGEGTFEGTINQDNILELSGTFFMSDRLNKSKVRLEFLSNDTIKGTYLIYAGSNDTRGRNQEGEFTASKVKGVGETNVQADRLNPEDAEAYKKKGYAHFTQGDYPTAIANYNEAIRLKPNYAEVYLLRGIARSVKGDYKEAIEDFNTSLRLKPDLVQAYYVRGLTRAEQKDYKGAIEDYTQVLHPQKFSGVGVQSEVNPQTKVLTVAKVIENSPSEKAGVKTGDQILAIDGQPTANMSLEQAIKLIRGQVGTQVTFRIGRAGRSAFNITLTRASIAAIAPAFAEIYYNRGLARIQIKEKQGAREDLQKAADLYNQQGQIDKAQNASAKIREIQQ